MSRITKMKYVAADTVLDYSLPTPGQTICKVLKVLGNSTFLVTPPDAEPFIASMPPKFRRHIYVRRNGFVVTEPIPEGKKVKGEIVRILIRDQIKHFHQKNVWPEAFKSTVYLDNTFSSLKNYRLTDQSDRGVVHGEKYFFMDGQNCRAVKKKKNQFSNVDNTYLPSAEFDVENYPCIEPNYNKKAVTRIVFSDEEDDSSDDEEESGDDASQSVDNENKSEDDEDESEDDEDESEDDEDESEDDEDESEDDEDESEDDENESEDDENESEDDENESEDDEEESGDDSSQSSDEGESEDDEDKGGDEDQREDDVQQSVDKERREKSSKCTDARLARQ